MKFATLTENLETFRPKHSTLKICGDFCHKVIYRSDAAESQV